MADGPSNNNLHIAVFPWLAFGHLLPFLQLSICLAQRGHRISFVSTPRNLQRLPKIPSTLTSLLTFISLPIPTLKLNNLPPNAESTADVSPDHFHYLSEAFDALEHPLASFLQHSHPNLLIYDFASYWLPPTADKLNLPCVYFDIFNASMVCFYGSVSEMMREDGGSRLTPEDYIVPPNWIPFPSTLALRLHEVPKRDPLKKKPKSFKSNVFRLGSAIQGCKLVAVRSCYEFEDEWLRLLEQKLCLKPVVPVGLLPPPVAGGDEDDERWVPIKEWLDKQREGSVVYVAFGSESAPSQDQMMELAYGLELSGLPFFWVVRKPPNFDPELSLLPTGFEDRMKEKGIGYVTMEWVPQLRILGHRSVGGFLTHGGWSSIVEGLGFGLVLIMLPFSPPQGLNSRLLEDKKIGLEIPRDERNGSLNRYSVVESVRVVMIGEQGEIFRSTAKEMGRTFADRERHDRYMNEFDRCLRKLCSHI